MERQYIEYRFLKSQLHKSKYKRQAEVSSLLKPINKQ